MFLLPLFSPSNLLAQDSVNIIVRDIDAGKFPKVKFFSGVFNNTGKPISGFDSTTISVIEKGKKSTPSVENYFKSDKEGLLICIAVDASVSLKNPAVENLKEGFQNLINELRPQDKMGVAVFHDTLKRLCDFTSDKGILKDVINGISTGKETNTELFSNIIGCLNWVNSSDANKRKILILISDGNSKGTKYKPENVIEIIGKSQVAVFSIASVSETKTTKEILLNLQNIAESSAKFSGRYFKTDKPSDIKSSISEILDRIKEELVITHTSTETAGDTVKGTLEFTYNGKNIAKEFSYFPKALTDSVPAAAFYKKKEFVIGAGTLVVVVVALMFFVSKRKKSGDGGNAKQSTEKNQEKYNKYISDYEELISTLEKQKIFSLQDRENISRLERTIQDAEKTFPGIITTAIDYKKRSQILDSEIEKSNGDIQSVPTLIIKNGVDKGVQYQLNTSGTTIGRLETDIQLNDETVSRKHAEIFFENDNFVIEDGSSKNGTFVNGTKISNSALLNGDTVRLGNTELIFSK